MSTILLCNKNIDHHARFKEKEHLFHDRALLEGNFFCCLRARADDAKIVRSKQQKKKAKQRKHIPFCSYPFS